MTDTNGADTVIYRNNNLVASGYFSLNGGYQTTTMVLLQRLDVNDVISIKAGNSIHIIGNPYTCLSVVQITM